MFTENQILFIKEQYSIYLKKNHDYGNSFVISLQKHGDLAFVIRAEDKVNRFKKLFNNTQKINDESIEDTVRDLFNYIAMFYSYKYKTPIIQVMFQMLQSNYIDIQEILFYTKILNNNDNHTFMLLIATLTKIIERS
jgi:hypothetical protein